MVKFIGAVALMAGLAACSADQVSQVQTDAMGVSSAVEGACSDATAAAQLATPFAAINPAIESVLGYVQAGCGTADAVTALVQKAVTDPSTIAWAEGLAGDLKAAVADVDAVTKTQ